MTEPLKPSLVIDRDTGKVCMQLRLGSFTATKELPDIMAKWSLSELQEYFDIVVPEMSEELHRMQREEQKKLRKKHK